MLFKELMGDVLIPGYTVPINRSLAYRAAANDFFKALSEPEPTDYDCYVRNSIFQCEYSRG